MLLGFCVCVSVCSGELQYFFYCKLNTLESSTMLIFLEYTSIHSRMCKRSELFCRNNLSFFIYENVQETYN